MSNETPQRRHCRYPGTSNPRGPGEGPGDAARRARLSTSAVLRNSFSLWHLLAPRSRNSHPENGRGILWCKLLLSEKFFST
jgi:hypothetical protein